jgi:hypothetical protein
VTQCDFTNCLDGSNFFGVGLRKKTPRRKKIFSYGLPNFFILFPLPVTGFQSKSSHRNSISIFSGPQSRTHRNHHPFQQCRKEKKVSKTVLCAGYGLIHNYL